jgi:hypothetical protein
MEPITTVCSQSLIESALAEPYVEPVEKPSEKDRFRDLGESDRVGCARIDFVTRTGGKMVPKNRPHSPKMTAQDFFYRLVSDENEGIIEPYILPYSSIALDA